ncbi:MAG: hypothetical protein WAV32_03745, partial [Halobacteriota archaeon]
TERTSVHTANGFYNLFHRYKIVVIIKELWVKLWFLALNSLSVSTSKGLMAKCARLYLPETLEISSFALIPQKDSEILM